MKFNEMKLSDKMTKALEKSKYETLTPIQEKIIPEIQIGRDVLGCSQTGSGKTGAFLIPIIEKLGADKNAKALVIAPTRELATQIMDNAKIFSDDGLPKALLIGGASIMNQLLAIQKHPRIIIGTPGRINDFLDSKRLTLDEFNILVLDEMDRMLDMGFSIQIDNIIKKIAMKRQTMLFSATMSKKIEKTTEKYLNNPVVIKIGETNSPSTNVSQEIINIENDKKYEALLNILKSDKTLFTLIFVKTKYGSERLAAKLSKDNVLAKAIHGDVRQTKREKIIQAFRGKKFNVLVATDVAARGLDIPHIDTVINYDLPQSPEDYIHRIGRCSRGLDVKGCSISFCSQNDRKCLDAIQSLIKDGDYDESKLRVKKGNPQNRKNGAPCKGNGKPHRDSGRNKKAEVYHNRDDSKKKVQNLQKGAPKQKNKTGSGYDFDNLISSKMRKLADTKRPSTYSVSKTSVLERRKKLGLIG